MFAASRGCRGQLSEEAELDLTCSIAARADGMGAKGDTKFANDIWAAVKLCVNRILQIYQNMTRGERCQQ